MPTACLTLTHAYRVPNARMPTACLGGPVPEINTIDPAVIKHILADKFERYTKPCKNQVYIFVLLGEFLGDGTDGHS